MAILLNLVKNSSELFPSNYSVIRKDRNFDNSKGGVLIAMKDDLIGTHRTDLDTKCELVWVTIKIQGSKDVTIGAFYRSPQFGDTQGRIQRGVQGVRTLPFSTTLILKKKL